MRKWSAANSGTATSPEPETEEDDDLLEEEDTEPTPGATATSAKAAKAKGTKEDGQCGSGGRVASGHHRLDQQIDRARQRCHSSL